LTFEFHRHADPADVVLRIEVSKNLEQWREVDTEQADDGGEMRFRVRLLREPERLMLRLRAELR
jgi:hypothetical protein